MFSCLPILTFCRAPSLSSFRTGGSKQAGIPPPRLASPLTPAGRTWLPSCFSFPVPCFYPLHLSMSSWLTIDPQSDFSLQNLPYGIVSHVGSDGKRVCASRIGDYAIDLSVLEAAGLFKDALNGEQKYFDQVSSVRPRPPCEGTLEALTDAL